MELGTAASVSRTAENKTRQQVAHASRFTLAAPKVAQLDVTSALWSGRSKIATVFLAALMVAGVYLGFVAAPEYTARADVRLALAPPADALPVERQTGIAGRKIEVETEKSVILGAEVLRRAAIPNRDSLGVRVIPGTLVLQITARAREAETAAQMADDVITAYLAHQIAQKAQARTEQMAVLSQRSDGLAAELAAHTADHAQLESGVVGDVQIAGLERQKRALEGRAVRMAGLPSRSAQHLAQIAALEEAADILGTRLDAQYAARTRLGEIEDAMAAVAAAKQDTLAQLHALKARTGTDRADAVRLTHATVPKAASKPRKSLVFSFFGLLGGLGGVAWALWSGLHRGGLRLPEVIEQETGLTVLAEIPEVKGPLARHQSGPPKSPFRAAFARLHLALSIQPLSRRVILCAGTAPQDGAGWTCLGLAQALGQKHRVLVIDTNMHNPTLAKSLVGATPAHGLAALLLGLADEGEVIRTQPDFGFDVIPGERLDGDPETLLRSSEFVHFLRDMRARYDVVLINAPPVRATSDTVLLAEFADAVLLCLRWDHTRADHIRDALAALHPTGTPVPGAVLTRQGIDPRPNFAGYTRWRDSRSTEAGAPKP
ncbi:MAG: hypothetical protein HRU30_16970 [Rhodobacteraceae bacterium]|nr:hypothetical protein [Paracoccaceae bacterium]